MSVILTLNSFAKFAMRKIRFLSHRLQGGGSAKIRSHQTEGFLRAIILFLCLLYLSPREFIRPFGSGLDPSWQIALQHAFFEGKVFGRDFIFTFGPLGIFCVRLPGINTAYVIYDIVLYLNIAILLSFLVNKLPLFLALLLPLASAISEREVNFESGLIWLLAALLWSSSQLIETRKLSFGIYSAFLSCWLLFARPNFGLIAAVIALGSLFVLVIKRKNLDAVIVSLLCFATILPLFCSLLHVDFFKYIVHSWSLISGYSEAMFFEPNVKSYNLPLAIIVIFSMIFLSILTLKREEFKSFHFFTVCTSIVLMFFFKIAFVRELSHGAFFFRSAWLPLVLLIAVTQKVQSKIFTLVGTFVILCGIILNRNQIEAPARSINRFVHYLHSMRNAFSSEHEISSSIEVPKAMVNQIGKKAVDVYPFDLSLAFSAKLTYKPRPIPQSYAAYTPSLDSENKLAVESESYAPYLLFHFHTMDYRYFLFEEPQTLFSILKRYRVTNRSDALLLLEKSAVINSQEKVIGSYEGGLNNRIEVPYSAHIIYGCFFIKQSWIGKLQTLVFRPPELRTMIELENGEKRNYRVIRPMLESCVPINYHVETLKDLEAFFSLNFRKLARIKSITFLPAGEYAYRPKFSYSLKEVQMNVNAFAQR